MAAHAPQATESHGFFLDHPGLTATIVTIVLAVGFIYAVYAGGTGGHHEGGAHGAASGTPAASAKPAAH
jgi:hypothetical protein